MAATGIVIEFLSVCQLQRCKSHNIVVAIDLLDQKYCQLVHYNYRA